MTTDHTRDIPGVEAAALGAGLGDLEVRRTTGGRRSAAATGVVIIAAGVALAVLAVLGHAGQVMPVVGVAGMILALLVVYTARKARNTLKGFLLACVLAVLLAAPGFVVVQLERGSTGMTVVALLMAAVLIVLGGLLLRPPRPGAAPPAESLSVYARGVVYVGADLDDGRPTVFPWSSTTIEESVAIVGGALHHTFAFRRDDGYWLTRTFDPRRRTDSRLIRRLRGAMVARDVPVLVGRMRAGETVLLGGGLRGTAAGLGTTSDGAPGQADPLAWHDVRGVGFDETSYVVRGARNHRLLIPLEQARDLGVLDAVIAAMKEQG